MSYEVLKMKLEKIPWKTWYSDNLLSVMEISEYNHVDDNYADDDNYGLYEGDDDSAFYHAYDTYKQIKCWEMKNVRSSVKGRRIKKYQNELIKDIKNYLEACGYLLINDPARVKQLVLMAGTTCCNLELVELIQSYWEEYWNTQDDWYMGDALDFSDIYIALGDSVLYEQNDFQLALMFYQLSLLKWKKDEKNNWNLSREITVYRKIKDKKYLNVSKDKNALINDCAKTFSEFFKCYDNLGTNIQELLTLSEVFANSYEVARRHYIVKGKKHSNEEKSVIRDEFRICYMMALEIYQNSFLLSTCVLAEDKEDIQNELKKYVIRGLYSVNNEFVKSVSKTMIRIGMSGKETYQTMLALLQSITCIDRISNILIEKEIKQDMQHFYPWEQWVLY